jgi:DNA-binding response OmpR family regulator
MSSPADPDFSLVPDRFAVRVAGQEIVVTPTQFRLLAVMMAEPGRTFGRAELVRRAFDLPVDERAIDVHTQELRRRLGSAGERVQTVPRLGYRYQPATPST